jgi:hypothetical protein
LTKRYKTTADAADAIGITPQALGKWAARPGAPVQTAKNGERRYLWPDFPRWREHELDRQARQESKPENTAEAERRYETARALKMEMEVAILQGEYIAVDDAAKATEHMLAQLRAQLLTLPQRWAPALVGLKTIPEVAQKLDSAVGEAMESLANGSAR